VDFSRQALQGVTLLSLRAFIESLRRTATATLEPLQTGRLRARKMHVPKPFLENFGVDDGCKSRAFGQKREKTKLFLIFSPKALA
jgi:hypothetical protein